MFKSRTVADGGDKEMEIEKKNLTHKCRTGMPSTTMVKMTGIMEQITVSAIYIFDQSSPEGWIRFDLSLLGTVSIFVYPCEF